MPAPDPSDSDFSVLPCLIPGWYTCVIHHAGCWEYDIMDWRLGMRYRGGPHHIYM